MCVNDAQCQQQNMISQRDHASERMATSFNVNDSSIELNNGLLFARPQSNESVMTFLTSAMEEFPGVIRKQIREAIILSTQDSMKVIFSGAWSLDVLTMSQTTTLFSFLDYQAKSRGYYASRVEHEEDSAVLFHTERNLAVMLGEQNKSIIGVLIYAMLKQQDFRLETVYSFIRNVESYWIANFLLNQVMNEDKESDNHKIRNASKIYGVSESYFRKLCHDAFSRGPKKQLRLWRAACSALQLIEKDNSIAAIAGNNGYASSSHFSSEIKSFFGITPREFKKLEDLLHE